MSNTSSKTIARVSFAIRVLLYLSVPVLLLYMGVSPGKTAAVVIAGVLLTWLIDLLTGSTIWVAVHRGTLAAYVVFLTAAALWMYFSREFSAPSLLMMLILLLALSSDAISNSRRWKLLLPFGVAVAALISLWRIRQTLLWGAAAYPLIPFLAAMARLIFPRTKHLTHTSLDYPPVRLEILSLGMKRVAAVGIRRNKLPLPHEQTASMS